MRITKFVHSCLLVEADHKILIDPGNYAVEARMLAVNKLPRLDFIVVSHEHPDHYHEGLLREVARHSPHAPIVTNNDLAKKIKALSLSNPIQTGSEGDLVVFEAKHELLPLGLPKVLNIGIHLNNKFTYPGDSYDFKYTREVLALPLTGPFASYKQALDAVVKLKPKVVLPLHDWEWHKAARQSRYQRAKEFLATKSIEFIELENAVSVEI